MFTKTERYSLHC